MIGPGVLRPAGAREKSGIDLPIRKFGKFIRAEFEKWGPVVKAAGVKAN